MRLGRSLDHGKRKGKLDQLHPCLNCGAQVRGNFCPICGQRNDDFKRPITSLTRELAEDALSLDSRFYRTLATLFLTPGQLTRDFADGKRARYTPPIRLYLLSTILLFLMLSFSNVALLSVDVAPPPSAQDGASEESALQIDLETTSAEFKSVSFFKMVKEPLKDTILIGDDVIEEAVSDARNNKAASGLARGFLEGINALAQDPRVANAIMNTWLPRVMILLLPLFAFTLKLFYVFRNQLLLNHAIYSLHFHSAIFLALSFLIGIQWALQGRLAGDILAQLFLGFTAFYSLFALKGFYRQGWVKTVLKWIMLGGAYVVLLGLSMSLAIWLNFEIFPK